VSELEKIAPTTGTVSSECEREKWPGKKASSIISDYYNIYHPSRKDNGKINADPDNWP